ncbi:MAG: invasion associated locus B family protein [Alphaproteobacteria bacterium]|nr:invasion associated locus B family protein [Alphaproteobacteria bacterium]
MMTASFLDRALRALAILVLSFGFAGAANAQTPYSLGSYTDWNVWELDEGGQKICYIVSEPKKQAGNYTRRGKPAVLVTRRPTPNVTDEVSVQPGYTYLEGSSVDLAVGQNEFTLFTRGAHAWTKDETEDRTLIDVMKRGENMVIKGESIKNTTSTDTYSLLGFTKAYNAMVAACSG